MCNYYELSKKFRLFKGITFYVILRNYQLLGYYYFNFFGEIFLSRLTP